MLLSDLHSGQTSSTSLSSCPSCSSSARLLGATFFLLLLLSLTSRRHLVQKVCWQGSTLCSAPSGSRHTGHSSRSPRGDRSMVMVGKESWGEGRGGPAGQRVNFFLHRKSPSPTTAQKKTSFAVLHAFLGRRTTRQWCHRVRTKISPERWQNRQA